MTVTSLHDRDFYGWVAEQCAALEDHDSSRLDWEGLKAALPSALAEALDDPRIRVAINGALLPNKTKLQAGAGDEIALLPPVSGG